MLIFILGISLCLNFVFTIAFLVIYRYSLKGVKNTLEKEFLKTYDKPQFDLREIDLSEGDFDD